MQRSCAARLECTCVGQPGARSGAPGRRVDLVPHTDRLLRAKLLTALGRVAAGEGSSDEAQRLLLTDPALHRSMEQCFQLTRALEELAVVAAQSGPVEAVRRAVAATELRAFIGTPLSLPVQEMLQPTLYAARRYLGSSAYANVVATTEATP
jgi:hypothetical protein